MIGNWARIMAGWGWPNNQRAVVCLFTASLSVYSSINLPSESIFFFLQKTFFWGLITRDIFLGMLIIWSIEIFEITYWLHFLIKFKFLTKTSQTKWLPLPLHYKAPMGKNLMFPKKLPERVSPSKPCWKIWDWTMAMTTAKQVRRLLFYIFCWNYFFFLLTVKK